MKTVDFIQTTKGYTAKVNGIITWFIRNEPRLKPGEGWFLYKSADGGNTFKLIPAKAVLDENGDATFGSTWGWPSLNSAKTAVYKAEID